MLALELDREAACRSDCRELSRARLDRNENCDGSLVFRLDGRAEAPKMKGSWPAIETILGAEVSPLRLRRTKKRSRDGWKPSVDAAVAPLEPKVRSGDVGAGLVIGM